MAHSRRLSLLLFSLCFFIFQSHFLSAQTVIKGGYWFPGSGFPVSNINASLFTHLFCAFADLDPNTYQVTISSSNLPQFSTFTQTVQQNNPSVKTLLSIGGGGSNSSNFSAMAAQPTTRKSFIDSSIQLARSYNFHGLDLDWEYPDTRTDMTNFGLLLNEWRVAVANESRTTGNTTLLLSAAVFRSSDYYTLDYPIQQISNSLDWVNIMAYDFYGPLWFPNLTAPPAPLYNPPDQVSGDAGVSSWIQSGLAANKLALGLPFYGYAWRLLDANNHGFFAPANGSANGGDGSMGYGQIRNFISQNGAQTVYNSTYVSDYCYSGTTWIGYDDTQSVFTKVTYAKQKGLFGYFAWHVGADNNWALSQTAFQAWGS
ncbi:hypothetical protein L6164_011498 [Bauhinia variegata]|uniref:Uncharacterized protein n=1 Tax=Bauhinia variegata TaxID=167791 RepID=A0ACB9P9Z1_BAUVA|nr:hypothetical protein L6164_011498 [Bauhinia variegata]